MLNQYDVAILELMHRLNDLRRNLILFVDKDRNCCVCSTPQSRKRTKFICTGCSDQPYLHAKDCFIKYHSKHLSVVVCKRNIFVIVLYCNFELKLYFTIHCKNAILTNFFYLFFYFLK